MSTKARRPVAVAMATPKASKAKHQSVLSKKALLDNFDLEVSHRTSVMREQLETTLSAFLTLVDAELLRIPRDMRRMTLGELDSAWAGSFAETARAMKRGEFERKHPERDEKEVMAEAVAVAGKRKRGAQTPLGGSPDRSTKNARTVQTSTKTQAQAQRKTPSKRTKPVAGAGKTAAIVGPSSGGLTTSRSGLPQNHVFNPLLPATPKYPRAPKRNESILSVNGSPLAIPTLRRLEDMSDPDAALDDEDGAGRERGAAAVNDNDEEEESNADEDEDEDDLPDPEAMEAAAEAALAKSLAKSTAARGGPTRPDSPSKSKRNRRPPSIMFRQSLAPGTAPLTSSTRANTGTGGGGSGASSDSSLPSAEIPLSDGRVISFNPLHLSPGRIDDELEQGGLGKGEKEAVKVQVRAAAVRALSEQMERWKVL